MGAGAYVDEELARLRDIVTGLTATAPRYVMFDNFPRVGDVRRFRELLG